MVKGLLEVTNGRIGYGHGGCRHGGHVFWFDYELCDDMVERICSCHDERRCSLISLNEFNSKNSDK